MVVFNSCTWLYMQLGEHWYTHINDSHNRDGTIMFLWLVCHRGAVWHDTVPQTRIPEVRRTTFSGGCLLAPRRRSGVLQTTSDLASGFKKEVERPIHYMMKLIYICKLSIIPWCLLHIALFISMPCYSRAASMGSSCSSEAGIAYRIALWPIFFLYIYYVEHRTGASCSKSIIILIFLMFICHIANSEAPLKGEVNS